MGKMNHEVRSQESGDSVRQSGRGRREAFYFGLLILFCCGQDGAQCVNSMEFLLIFILWSYIYHTL